jgi:hypothetical protein
MFDPVLAYRASRLHLMGLSALLGILQNHPAPLSVGQPPFFDLIQRSKTAKAGQVIAQTAISYAR